MQPFLGPPSSPIPLQPFVTGSSRLLGPTAQMMQVGAPTSFMPGQIANMATSRAGGGLISRLLGGSSLASGSFGGGGFGGGGLNLTTILNHTQRVMGITQQVAPMVQQYGPFVKNVPTLWKLMRSMKTPKLSSTSSTQAQVGQNTQTTPPQTDTSEPITERQDSTTNQVVPETEKKTNRSGISVPKLYV